jgi:hypothetical protein
MVQRISMANSELIFRRHPFWVLVDLTLAAMVATCCILAGIWLQQFLPLIGLPLMLLRALIIRLRYTNEAIILRGAQLIFRSGLVVVSEQPYSLLIHSPTTAQGPIGRWLNYGTVTMIANSKTSLMRRVEQFNLLQKHLSARQTALIIGRHNS